MDYNTLVDNITKKILQELAQREKPSWETQARKPLSSANGKLLPVGISARHVHLTREIFEQLYGRGKELTVYTELYQPGEFASAEVITLIGPRLRAIQDVRILGPFREYTQVELSRTDGVALGIDPPVRKSGDLNGSEPIILVGPAGAVSLKEGAICANRHVHTSPQDAERLEVKDDGIVKVRVSGVRAITFENVQIRVSDKFLLQMHLDTDDANAAGVKCGESAELVK
ncbi:MAG: Phosphate propanoyltransferase [Candidatus Poribacteria bacterium]|nr:Phosphate propanoyltransferase [Candidatus Poribacteria bacterium]